MSLPVQVLRLCAAWLALGLVTLAVRGVPRPAPAGGETAVCSAPSTFEPATPWIALDDARALHGDPTVLFIDCRPTPQFRTGHVSGALSLPSDTAEIAEPVIAILRGARTLIAYCDAKSGCASSQRLASRLHELGIVDVRILRGGLPSWLEKGYPAESGNCRLCP